MKRWFARQRSWISFGSGLAAGLLVGVGLLVGGLIGSQYAGPAGSTLLPPAVPLHATATHGGESFAIATGTITPEVEGIFFLDYLTGELQCRVINVRTGQLGGMFKHNVFSDLGVEKGKKPSFLMVTGLTQFRAFGGGTQLAGCVCYVTDANTGIWAAYALPWNRQAEAVGATQVFPMQVIGTGKARELAIRDQ